MPQANMTWKKGANARSAAGTPLDDRSKRKRRASSCERSPGSPAPGEGPATVASCRASDGRRCVDEESKARASSARCARTTPYRTQCRSRPDKPTAPRPAPGASRWPRRRPPSRARPNPGGQRPMATSQSPLLLKVASPWPLTVPKASVGSSTPEASLDRRPRGPLARRALAGLRHRNCERAPPVAAGRLRPCAIHFASSTSISIVSASRTRWCTLQEQAPRSRSAS